MADRAPIDLKYLESIGAIMRLQGRPYLTHPGLLRVAAENGLESIVTEVVHANYDGGAYYMCATVTGDRGTFTGHGDAGPDNVSRTILPHAFRMAETRAVGRALRYYLGLGLTLQEELGGTDSPPRIAPEAPRPAAPAPPSGLQEGAESWIDDLSARLGVDPQALVDLIATTGRNHRTIPPDKRDAAEGWLTAQVARGGGYS